MAVVVGLIIDNFSLCGWNDAYDWNINLLQCSI